MTIKENVKILIGEVDDNRDKLIDVIIDLTSQRLINLLDGVEDIPRQLEYIVTEVAIARFNKIGSEGTSGHSVDGESLSFKDDDFDIYLDDIEKYKDSTNTQKGKVVFL